jgi:hypothetical protein
MVSCHASDGQGACRCLTCERSHPFPLSKREHTFCGEWSGSALRYNVFPVKCQKQVALPGKQAMEFTELSNEQRRQRIDIVQTFTVWHEASRRFDHSYGGVLRWVTKGGKQYLMRTTGKQDRGMGPRSPETEKIKADYDAARKALKERKKTLWAKLVKWAKINRAYDLGRVPKITARILRELDDVGLLGTSLHVVGTNSMFGYEARAGVILGNDIVATGDADLLWDIRRNLRLAGDVKAEGVLGLLRRVDKSFSTLGPRSFRAANDDGFMVDLIRPMEDLRRQTPEKIGDSAEELYGVEILGLEWLINAPKFSQVVIAEDGLPLWMHCIDPRVFAMHKKWVSERPDRSPEHKFRDRAQSAVVAELCRDYLALRFDDPALSAIPKELLRGF